MSCAGILPPTRGPTQKKKKCLPAQDNRSYSEYKLIFSFFFIEGNRKSYGQDVKKQFNRPKRNWSLPVAQKAKRHLKKVLGERLKRGKVAA